MAETGAALLQAYKEQYGIEKNFSFLKRKIGGHHTYLSPPPAANRGADDGATCHFPACSSALSHKVLLCLNGPADRHGAEHTTHTPRPIQALITQDQGTPYLSSLRHRINGVRVVLNL
ncbi:MAG TPA: hypothetical protein ENK84_02250 [Desulfobulbus sp.]|nr:hypothetical protein [Desulfobulbus sp.]